jgi:hypothetical protein
MNAQQESVIKLSEPKHKHMKLKTISTCCPVAYGMQKDKPHYTAGTQNAVMAPVHKIGTWRHIFNSF